MVETESEMRREEPEGKDRLKVRKRGVKKGTERKGPSRTESQGEPESVSVWRRSWRGSAPTRLPGRSWSPGGRSQGRAPEAASGGRRWSGWAEVGEEGRTPPNHRPRRAGVAARPGEWPGGRSLTDPGGRHCPASGGCGRARAVARRAASNGPARAACILPGPAGRGGPFWAAPLSWAGSPRLGTEVPLERGAPDTGCREPSGAWLGVPAGPGGPSGAGLRLLQEGDPLGRGPFAGTRSRVGRAPGL